jgi:TRAP-type C4-dicarboxylate transport system substrate-binding protein
MSDFLDELVSDQQFNENVDQGTMGRIEVLIWHSSMSDIEKAREMRRMLKLESMEAAYRMVKFLQDFQPEIGFHRAPMTQYESVEATRIRADREDFKERKK